MSMVCDETQPWGIGKCENPRCGKEEALLYPVTLWEAPRLERSRTFEVCELCRAAHDRGQLKLHTIAGRRAPGAPS